MVSFLLCTIHNSVQQQRDEMFDGLSCICLVGVSHRGSEKQRSTLRSNAENAHKWIVLKSLVLSRILNLKRVKNIFMNLVKILDEINLCSYICHWNRALSTPKNLITIGYSTIFVSIQIDILQQYTTISTLSAWQIYLATDLKPWRNK